MPYVQLLGAQIAIGAAAIFARYALTGAGPIVTSALRLAIAALPMIAFAALRRPRSVTLRREAELALAGGVLGVHFAAWIASLQYTSVAVSTLLVATTPLFTEMYDSLVRRRLPSKRIMVALIVAVAGLILIAVQKTTPAPIPGRGPQGITLALLGALAMAAYLVLVRSAGISPSGGEPLPTTAIVARTFTWAALMLAAASIAVHQAPPRANDQTAWCGILGMGLVSQLLGHTGLNAALKTFSPTVVSAATLLEPVVAAVLAALIFGEALHPLVIAGGALVLGAVGLALTRLPARDALSGLQTLP